MTSWAALVVLLVVVTPGSPQVTIPPAMTAKPPTPPPVSIAPTTQAPPPSISTAPPVSSRPAVVPSTLSPPPSVPSPSSTTTTRPSNTSKPPPPSSSSTNAVFPTDSTSPSTTNAGQSTSAPVSSFNAPVTNPTSPASTTQATPIASPSSSSPPDIASTTTIAPANHSTAPPATSDDSSSTSSSLLVVGVAVAAVVMILIALCFCFFHRKRAQSSKPPRAAANTTGGGMLHTADDISFTSSSEPSLNWSHLEPFKIPLEDIVLVHPLAAGAYGEVWLGQYHHQRVAIKTCLASRASRKHLQSFIDELSLVGSLQSRHIVKLLGAGWFRPTDLLAVLEYMNLGDLREYLNDHHPGPDHHSKQTLNKVECATSIANALAYLHAKRIIHRDLKSRNVLLDDTKGAKLADFGIARTYSVDETMTAAAGTYRWMAPEVLMFKQYTIAVDVYSFGVVLSELDTHAVPYSHVRNDKGHAVSDTALLAMVLYHNLRPTFSATCPPWLSELALKCMDSDPAQRPEPAEIVAILNAQMMSSMV